MLVNAGTTISMMKPGAPVLGRSAGNARLNGLAGLQSYLDASVTGNRWRRRRWPGSHANVNNQANVGNAAARCRRRRKAYHLINAAARVSRRQYDRINQHNGDGRTMRREAGVLQKATRQYRQPGQNARGRLCSTKVAWWSRKPPPTARRAGAAINDQVAACAAGAAWTTSALRLRQAPIIAEHRSGGVGGRLKRGSRAPIALTARRLPPDQIHRTPGRPGPLPAGTWRWRARPRRSPGSRCTGTGSMRRAHGSPARMAHGYPAAR